MEQISTIKKGVEKIILKPVAKEFIFKGNEPGVAIDAFSYQGGTNQEKNLGTFSLVGHIKFGEEDMSYLISLVSSLAKREYYSESSLHEKDPKVAFEKTLKKINEVLQDFFDKKEFKLNLGLLAISGENIYISKLGRFKVALARDGKYIDILNNVELFSKDTTDEKQFSNIISGKIRSGDKVFAYFPNRQLTSKEKILNPLLTKGTQEEFSEKMAQLASTNKGFSCCGIFVSMKETKEIQIKSAFPNYSNAEVILTDAPIKQSDTNNKPTSKKIPKDEEEDGIEDGKELGEKPTIYEYDPDKDAPLANGEAEVEDKEEPQEESDSVSPAMQHQKVMAAELSVGKRANVFTTLAGRISKFKTPSVRGSNKKLFTTLAVLVVIPLIVFTVMRSGGSSETKNILSRAKEELKTAQTQISQNDVKNARFSLQAALLSLVQLNSNDAEKTKKEISQTLDSIDKISDKKATLVINWSEKNPEAKARLITMIDSSIYAYAEDGSVYSVTSDNISNVGDTGTGNKFLLGGKKSVIAFNGSELITLLNPSTKATEPVKLSDPIVNISANFYEDNLYTLSENKIYKYADIATGDSKRVDWGSDNQSGTLIDIAIDGNIFALSNDGKLIKYFKGKKESEFDLQMIPSTDSKLSTFTDSPFIYISNRSTKKVYIFGKNDGILKTTYKFDELGDVQNLYIAKDGTVLILLDSELWKITP